MRTTAWDRVGDGVSAFGPTIGDGFENMRAGCPSKKKPKATKREWRENSTARDVRIPAADRSQTRPLHRTRRQAAGSRPEEKHLQPLVRMKGTGTPSVVSILQKCRAEKKGNRLLSGIQPLGAQTSAASWCSRRSGPATGGGRLLPPKAVR